MISRGRPQLIPSTNESSQSFRAEDAPSVNAVELATLSDESGSGTTHRADGVGDHDAYVKSLLQNDELQGGSYYYWL